MKNDGNFHVNLIFNQKLAQRPEAEAETATLRNGVDISDNACKMYYCSKKSQEDCLM